MNNPPSSRKPLKDQKALVTGANSGIGEACALGLAAAGASVVVNYVSKPEEAERVVATIRQNGGEAIAIQADVSHEEQVRPMFAEMIKRFGTIDILVNNAGLQRDAAFHEMTLEQWNTVISINLTVPAVSSAAGKIICMSSVHEVIPWGGHVNYAASKGGVMLMMKSMAQELAPRKIRVNSIGPGAIKTPINRDAWETPEAERKLLTLIPEGRVGVPDDIARAAIWLASDASDYVTGTTLFVDGGMTLYPGFATGG
jgi:glucose 1-dehydrogenase